MKLSPSELETLVHRELRALPDHAAPLGWTDRVQAELARRQSLPWWRQPFGAWPRSARALFLLLSFAAAAGLVGLLVWAAPASEARWAAWSAACAGRWQGWFGWAAVLRETRELLLALARSLPASYWGGAIALAAAGYAVIIFLGAALHRARGFRRSV